jgi:hypothetical protein
VVRLRGNQKLFSAELVPKQLISAHFAQKVFTRALKRRDRNGFRARKSESDFLVLATPG